ncbi:MAG: acyl-CoA thioesterase [Alphaproteobacteria bacterium]|nr:acyl-CoA thioesterase [Alphaproteobacteria bacterium]NCQ88174.1 acyl-CoA thioesterase [Alphaproteobacteria bacterium]NCT05319.1 acyl-CoA thioesterase [Alphaproteobacteria bacterium]
MTQKLPDKIPTLRVVPLPADTNAYGDIFGGWLLSQMDLAGASEATSLAKCRVVTVGVDSMNFHQPVFVGDEVSFYTEIVRTGRSSIAVHVQSWARARAEAINNSRMVTEGVFTFVAIDENRKPVEIAQ